MGSFEEPRREWIGGKQSKHVKSWQAEVKFDHPGAACTTKATASNNESLTTQPNSLFLRHKYRAWMAQRSVNGMLTKLVLLAISFVSETSSRWLGEPFRTSPSKRRLTLLLATESLAS